MSKARNIQQRRRRKNNRGVPKSDLWFEMIDGNCTHQPYAYCKSKGGYLTKNMAICHGCEAKHCTGFELYLGEEETNAHDDVRASDVEP